MGKGEGGMDADDGGNMVQGRWFPAARVCSGPVQICESQRSLTINYHIQCLHESPEICWTPIARRA